MKNFLTITTLLIITFAFSDGILNATEINKMIAATGYVSSEPAYSSVGKGYVPSEPAYSSAGKGYNSNNSGYSSAGKGYNSNRLEYSNIQNNNNSSNAGYNSLLQNSSKTEMDKAHQDALKWIQEHPQEAQQLQQMLQTLKSQ